MAPSKDVYNRRVDFSRLITHGKTVREAAEILAPVYHKTVARLIDDWSQRHTWGFGVKEKDYADKVVYDHIFAIQQLKKELWAIINDNGTYTVRSKLTAIRVLKDIEFKGLAAAQSLGFVHEEPLKVADMAGRAPKTVERIEYLLLTGQLDCLSDAMDDADFESTYGAPAREGE